MSPTKNFRSLAEATGIESKAGAPMLVEISNGKGPTVLVIGGIHGDEHEAQIVLGQIAEQIDPTDVVGRIIIIPILNYPAAQEGQRVSAQDKQNMNRVFPGQPRGTPTERIADWLVAEMFPLADLLIDVHAGGRDVAVVPMIFGFSDGACRTSPDRLSRVMRGWGYGLIQHMECVPGTVCHAALAKGLASVEVEGGGGRMLTGELDVMRQGLLNGLTACGALKGEVARFDGIEVDAPEEGQIYASTAGVVEHLVKLGERVEAGQVIAALHRLGGRDEAPLAVEAPIGGILLRQTQHAWVSQGRQIGNVGAPRSNARRELELAEKH